MPFLTLGEAVDRVLARLADQRNEKPGEVLSLPGKEARAEGGRRAPALARSDRLSPRTTVRRGANEGQRRQANGALPSRSLE